MVRHIKLIFAFVITCFLLSGCSKLNPFVPPANQTEEKSSDGVSSKKESSNKESGNKESSKKESDKKESSKKESDKKESDKKESDKKESDMSSVDKELEENKKITEKNSDKFYDKFSEKTDKTYYEAMDRYTAPDKHESGETATEYMLKNFYRSYLTIRHYSLGFFIGSIVLGILGMMFSIHNKGSRRFFLVTFIIGIPAIIILIVFGIGTLNSKYLYN